VTTDAYRDAWLAEMWPVCREVPRAERQAEKATREAISQPVDKAVVNRSVDCEKAS
jgi:hypothetical protein